MPMPLVEFVPTFFDTGLALRDCWRWMDDGEREPYVTVIPSRQADLPCRTTGSDAACMVEVPLLIASIYDPLAWLVDGYLAGEYGDDQGLEPRAGVAGLDAPTATCCYRGMRRPVPEYGFSLLVPLWQWRVWCIACASYPIVNPGDVTRLIGHAAMRGRSPRPAGARARDLGRVAAAAFGRRRAVFDGVATQLRP